MSPDDAALSDPYIGHNERGESQERTIADLDERILVENTSADLLGVCDVLVWVRRVYDGAVAGYADIVADKHAALANDMYVLLDIDVISDDELRGAMWGVYDRFESDTVPDLDPAAQENMLRVRDEHWSPDDALRTDGTEHHVVQSGGLDSPVQIIEQVAFLVERLTQDTPDSRDFPARLPDHTSNYNGSRSAYRRFAE